MPLAIKIILIVIGILLLVLALIGSGISRRLMTIPKMHRAPRIVLAVLGVLLLATGGLLFALEKEKHGPSQADLKAHIPPKLMGNMACEEHPEAPEGAVQMVCSEARDGMPDQVVYYIMFPNRDAMQDYWQKTVEPENLSGTKCDSKEDFDAGGQTTYTLGNSPDTVGNLACGVDADGITSATYTDQRFNIIVQASHKDPQSVSAFVDWVNSDASQPVKPTDSTAATAQFHTETR